MRKHKELIFLWGDMDEYGVFITRNYFEFLNTFYRNKQQSKTFGEFWNLLGESGRGFVKPFMQCDDRFPEMDEKISDIESEIWILDDQEFPITQCVEETYTNYSDLMPEEYCKEFIKTEYGQEIGMFLIADFVYLKDLMENNNCMISSLKSPFPMNIYNYGN